MMSAKMPTGINNLVEQVLIELFFRYLNSNDRKNSRLVCKKWNTTIFGKKAGVLNVPRWYSPDSVSMVLSRTTCPTLAPRFIAFSFKNRDLVFPGYSEKIESIHFQNCRVDFESLTSIFQTCQNLKEFISYRCDISRSTKRHFLEVKHTESSLKKILTVRENLIKLRLDKANLSDIEISIVSTVFPNLEIFEIEYESLVDQKRSSKSKNHNYVRFHTLADRLKNLKELTLNGLSRAEKHITYFTSTPSQAEFDWTMLKNIKMSLDQNILNTERLDRIRSHQHWTSLEVCFPDVDLTVLADLIERNPTIQKFKITMREIDSEFVNKIVAIVAKSSLKSLDFDVRDLDEETRFPSDDDVVNTTVRNIYITAGPFGYKENQMSVNSCLCRIFFTRFLELRWLSTGATNLYEILEYQNKLNQLTVVILNEDEEMKMVEPIEHHCLESLKVKYLLTKRLNFLSKYRLQNLKHLTFVTNSRTSPHNFKENFKSFVSTIVKNFPKLEELQFSFNGYKSRANKYEPKFKIEELAPLFEKCKALRKVVLELDIWKEDVQGPEISCSTVESCFLACPSLRTLWICLSEIKIFGYFDIISKTLNISRNPETYNNYFTPFTNIQNR